jgi:hypothetical protein
MSDVKRTVNAGTQNTTAVVERDEDIAEIKTDIMRQFSSGCVNGLERLGNLVIGEKAEQVEYIGNLVYLSKVDWWKLGRNGKKF